VLRLALERTFAGTFTRRHSLQILYGSGLLSSSVHLQGNLEPRAQLRDVPGTVLFAESRHDLGYLIGIRHRYSNWCLGPLAALKQLILTSDGIEFRERLLEILSEESLMAGLTQQEQGVLQGLLQRTISSLITGRAIC